MMGNQAPSQFYIGLAQKEKKENAPEIVMPQIIISRIQSLLFFMLGREKPTHRKS